MTRWLSAALASVALAAAAPAEEKVPGRPTGTWVREAGDRKMSFTVRADTLVFRVEDGGGNSLEVRAAYGVTPDGTLFGIVTGTEARGVDNPPQKGELFSFRYTVGKDTLTIDDLRAGSGASDEAKQLVQGEYKKAK
jgi:hypothetical protein